MIKYVSGNFFDFNADIRVNTVNCVGVMGAGAALQFKKKYPKMFKEYLSECKVGNVQIGVPHVWQDNEIFEEDKTIIINFPTKKHWRNPSKYEYVESGLKWLSKYLKNKPNSTITLPALGCGNGGLDWSRVKVMIEEYLKGLSSEILVFEPNSSLNDGRDDFDLDFLNEQGIKVLKSIDHNYPQKLKGKSASTIFLKGDKTIFRYETLSIFVNSKANERERNAIINTVNAIPNGNFTYLLGFNSSFEIDLVKLLLAKKNRVLLVIPYGILQIIIRKDLKEYWDEKLITVISISNPKQKWNHVENQNSLKFRIKISDVILITHYEFKLFEDFEDELNQSNSAKFYINYWKDSNDFFNRIAARKIGRDRKTHDPNVSPILSYLTT